MFNIPSLYRVTIMSDGVELFRDEYATSAMDAVQMALINHNAGLLKAPKSVKIMSISLAPTEIEAITARVRQQTDDVIATLFQPKL